jgi:hypothetical protein
MLSFCASIYLNQKDRGKFPQRARLTFPPQKGVVHTRTMPFVCLSVRTRRFGKAKRDRTPRTKILGESSRLTGTLIAEL